LKIEVRMDSAFFSDAIVSALDEMGIEFTLSVPFERFAELKKKNSKSRTRWRSMDETWSFLRWPGSRRVEEDVSVSFHPAAVSVIRKEPIQLDLFIPYE